MLLVRVFGALSKVSALIRASKAALSSTDNRVSVLDNGCSEIFLTAKLLENKGSLETRDEVSTSLNGVGSLDLVVLENPQKPYLTMASFLRSSKTRLSSFRFALSYLDCSFRALMARMLSCSTSLLWKAAWLFHFLSPEGTETYLVNRFFT